MVDHIIDFVGIDEVGHAEFLRHFDSVVIQVDTNNPCGADEACTLDHIETDSTQTENSNSLAGFHIHGERNRADTSRDTAADVTNFIEGGIFSHFGNGNFG